MKFKMICSSLTLLAIFFFASSFATQQFNLEGIWLTEGGRAKIKIEQQTDGSYKGKLIWSKDQSAEAKKHHGATIIDKMKKVNDIKFEGNIYDPSTNSQYSSTIKVISNDKIDLRGYLGISLIGRTEQWTRVSK